MNVDYDGAGLTRIDVHDGALTFVWYTGRKDSETGMPDMRQSLAAYDKHVFQARLTPAPAALPGDPARFLRRGIPVHPIRPARA